MTSQDNTQYIIPNYRVTTLIHLNRSQSETHFGIKPQHFLPSLRPKMAGGAFVSEAGGSYEGGVTVFVIITCVVAAMGGLLFGYDLGISGGVTSMEEFLSKFFPQVERQMEKSRHETAYCKFDNQMLQLFTSSLYLAALVASFWASVITRKHGRKVSMFIGGLAFLIGALFNAFATNVLMLIIGRLLLGVGVGFANQVSHLLSSLCGFFVCDNATSIIKGWLRVKSPKFLVTSFLLIYACSLG